MRQRTIVAVGGGGFGRVPYDPRLDDYLLSHVDSPRPKIALLPQATAENKPYIVQFFQAYAHRAEATWISLFERRTNDLRSELLSQDIIFVGGGNTANLLAIWRVHGVDEILQEAWHAGIVLSGVSAGANCWFESSVTDSFGPELCPLQDGLAFLPGSFCPHYDAEASRRPVYQESVAGRALPSGYAADDGVAITFRDTKFSEAVSISPEANAWRVEHRSVEERLFAETKLTPRLLGQRDDQLSTDQSHQEQLGHGPHGKVSGRVGNGRSRTPE